MADVDQRTLELSLAIGKAMHGFSYLEGHRALLNMMVDLVVQSSDTKAEALMSSHAAGCELIHAVNSIFDTLKACEEMTRPMGPAQGNA